MAFAHLHTWAGYDCVCERCGSEWNDAGPEETYAKVDVRQI